jgi:glycosyltransferase involved in cell wall biosynthesis
MVGLIDSPYFVEAVLRAKEEVPNLKCLLVGESSYLQSSIVASGSGADAFIDVGAVPYREVAGYLAASDVGTYPVPGTSYDDGRSPIKIFEYTAAGCSVVSPPIREVRRLNFSNVVYAEANAKSFADGIIRACRTSPPQEETIEDYDWHNLAKKLEHSAQPMI